MTKQAWAQNAVITSDDGRLTVSYKPRCPQCGYVPPNRSATASCQEGLRNNIYDRCDSCGTNIHIVISRG